VRLYEGVRFAGKSGPEAALHRGKACLRKCGWPVFAPCLCTNAPPPLTGGGWGAGEAANGVPNGAFPLTPTLPRQGGGRILRHCAYGACGFAGMKQQEAKLDRVGTPCPRGLKLPSGGQGLPARAEVAKRWAGAAHLTFPAISGIIKVKGRVRVGAHWSWGYAGIRGLAGVAGAKKGDGANRPQKRRPWRFLGELSGCLLKVSELPGRTLALFIARLFFVLQSLRRPCWQVLVRAQPARATPRWAQKAARQGQGRNGR